MAIALVGTVGAVTAASSPVTPGWGSGETRTANNLLICCVQVNSLNAAGVTISAGWTAAGSFAYSTSGTNHGSILMWYRIATGADAAPTVTLSGQFITAQLMEFSGNSTSPLDQVGSTVANATTSPITATAGAVDAAAGDLIIYTGASTYSVATAGSTISLALNNGATAHSTTSSGNVAIYNFGYGITTSKAVADAATATFTTTNITAAGLLLASFKAISGTQPGTPTSVSASPGDTTALVSWTPPTGGTDTSYTITPFLGGFAQPATTISAPATSTTITGLINGFSYYFTVLATNANGSSVQSVPSNTVVPAGAYVTPPADDPPGGFTPGPAFQRGTVPSEPVIYPIYRGNYVIPLDTLTPDIVRIDFLASESTDDLAWTTPALFDSADNTTGFYGVHTRLDENSYYQYRCIYVFSDGTKSAPSDAAIPGHPELNPSSDLNVDQLASRSYSTGLTTSGIFRGVIFQTASRFPKVQMDPTGIFALDAFGNTTFYIHEDGEPAYFSGEIALNETATPLGGAASAITWGTQSSTAQSAFINHPSFAFSTPVIGSVPWNYANSFTSNGQGFAQLTLADPNLISNYLVGTNYGFNLPLNATISQIQFSVGVGWTSAATPPSDYRIYPVRGGKTIGANLAQAGTWDPHLFNATRQYVTSSSGLLPSDINASDFGIALSAQGVSGESMTVSITSLQIQVQYLVNTLASDGSFIQGTFSASSNSHQLWVGAGAGGSSAAVLIDDSDASDYVLNPASDWVDFLPFASSGWVRANIILFAGYQRYPRLCIDQAGFVCIEGLIDWTTTWTYGSAGAVIGNLTGIYVPAVNNMFHVNGQDGSGNTFMARLDILSTGEMILSTNIAGTNTGAPGTFGGSIASYINLTGIRYRSAITNGLTTAASLATPGFIIIPSP